MAYTRLTHLDSVSLKTHSFLETHNGIEYDTYGAAKSWEGYRSDKQGDGHLPTDHYHVSWGRIHSLYESYKLEHHIGGALRSYRYQKRTNIGPYPWIEAVANPFKVHPSRSGSNKSFSWHHPELLSAFNTCSVKAWAKAGESEMDIGMMLAELGETTSYLASRMTQLVRFLSHVRKGKFRRANKLYGSMLKSARYLDTKSISRLNSIAARSPVGSVRKIRNRHLDKGKSHFRPFSSQTIRAGSLTAAKAHLEYKYAVMPLLYDIEALIEQNVQDSIIDIDEHGLTAKVSEALRGRLLGDAPYYGQYGRYQWDYDWTVRVQLMFKLNWKKMFFQNIGFGSYKRILWELVPFSFVWDWWNPIGDYLTALDFKSSVEQYWLTESIQLTGKDFTWYEIDNTVPRKIAWRKDENFGVFKAYQRKVVKKASERPLVPYVKNPLYSDNVTTFAALVRSGAFSFNSPRRP